MAKVYVITQGNYSDYHICHITTSKKKAQAFVTFENGKESELYGCDYKIETYELDDFEIDNGKYEYGVGYKIDINNGGKISIYGKGKRRKFKNHGKGFLYYIWLPQADDEKAKKIAYDMYMKQMAEKNGL